MSRTSPISVLLLATASMSVTARAQSAQKGVMLMNRIGPSASTLYVASADGSNERELLPTSGFDYHASYSTDGRWIVTSIAFVRTAPDWND